MAKFAKGNKFWEKRTKVGRERLFTEPEQLREACYEYFNYVAGREYQIHEGIKGGEFSGQTVIVPKERPFTVSGLCIFLGVNTKYFNDFMDGLDLVNSDVDRDFSEVITHVREVIYTQKLEGAIVGVYNASIVSKELHLRSEAEAPKNDEADEVIDDEVFVIGGKDYRL